MIPFSVNLREEDGKLIGIFFYCLFPHHLAESNVGEEAYGDIKVDVSADDFFAIYNGEVGASQLASMILSGRVYVRRFKYKQVSDFASSFDFSSHKWEEFYEMKGILATNTTMIKMARNLLNNLYFFEWALDQ